MSIILSLLIALHVLVCAFMILVVLMQRPRSEGLGSAFGGGITDNVFGSQTTNVLAKFTTWMGIAFFAITLLLSILTAKANSSCSLGWLQRLSVRWCRTTQRPIRRFWFRTRETKPVRSLLPCLLTSLARLAGIKSLEMR